MFVEERAVAYLEYPEKYPALEPWVDHELVFRAWIYDLDRYGSWLLRETKDAFWVRRLQWDRSKDAQTSQGEPSIYGSQAIVPTDSAKIIVEQLHRLTLPPFLKPESFGTDGVIFGVETKSLYLNSRLSWWGKPPETWQPVTAWLEQTMKVFDSLLPESTAKMSGAERMARWKRAVAEWHKKSR